MDQEIAKNPDLNLAHHVFILRSGPQAQRDASVAALMAAIKKDNMAPFYESVCQEFNLPVDKSLLSTMQKANQDELAKMEEKLQDATENLGETDISDALIAKANYYTKIGDKEKALTAWRTAYDKTVPLGARIDMMLTTVRIGFFFFDNDIISRNIEKARTLIEEGGDWDRRNRLRVYEGIYLMSIRDFTKAANLLLDALATFTCTELMEYKDFVRYTVLASILTLDRPSMKKRVLTSPEILEVIHEIPDLESFSTSLYNCNYAQFFKSLAAIEQQLKSDRVLFSHYRYYVRELRIHAYTQLLESYRSVTIESMANSFGVSEDFIDADLSKFIASGRIHAVVDKVGGVVETNRPDHKNAQYQNCIKQGDLLLNRIQKLGRVINA